MCDAARRMRTRLAFGAWIALITASTDGSLTPPAAGIPSINAHSGNQTLFEGYELSWDINPAQGPTGAITLSIDARTTGWVGFGLAEAGGMPGADIVVASVNENGEATVRDYWASGYVQPQPDVLQDWTLVSASQEGDMTHITLQRALYTDDMSQDRPFAPTGNQPLRVIGAMGSSDVFSYHGPWRQAGTVDFFGVAGDELERLRDDPDVYTRDILPVNYTIPAPCNVPFQACPSTQDCEEACLDKATTYTSFCFDVSQLPPTHLYAVEPLIQPGNEQFVHHYFVSLMEDCAGTFEQNMVYTWAPGAKPLALPEEAGFPLGERTRIQRILLYTHYTNPELLSNVKDSSGVRLYLSEKLRPNDAATIILGDSWTNLVGAQLPQGRSRFDFECPSSVTINFPHPITVVWRLLHMHETGESMFTSQYDAEGRHLRSSEHEYYDYDFQTLTRVDAEPWTVNPGDSLRTSCFYNTGGSSDIIFGTSSYDEMCQDFVMYYPALSWDFRTCGVYSSAKHQGKWLGGAVPATGQSAFDFTGRHFGRDPRSLHCNSSATFAHPIVGGCANFDQRLCELYGFDEFGAGTAREHCCTCKSLPPICEDQPPFPNVAEEQAKLEQPFSPAEYIFYTIRPFPLISCEQVVQVAQQVDISCDTVIPEAFRSNLLLPAGFDTLAGACPSTCNVCTNVECPPGCVKSFGPTSRSRRLLFSSTPCPPGCSPQIVA